jgi:hypothetical protein
MHVGACFLEPYQYQNRGFLHWFRMENPGQMNDLGYPVTPILRNLHPTCCLKTQTFEQSAKAAPEHVATPPFSWFEGSVSAW